MTRAGLEPATYGSKERMIIEVLASLSIAKPCLRIRFPPGELSLRIARNRVHSHSLEFFPGSNLVAIHDCGGHLSQERQI